MATSSLNPGVGPTNADVATAVATAVPTLAQITSAVTTNAASAGVTNASIASAITANAASAGVTMTAITNAITSNAASAGVTLAAIGTQVANNASRFSATWTNLGFVSSAAQSSVTFSNLSGYKYLRLICNYMSCSNNGALNLRFNSDSTPNNYHWFNTYIQSGSQGLSASIGSNEMRLTDTMSASSSMMTYLEIDNSNYAVTKKVFFQSSWQSTSGQWTLGPQGQGIWRSTAAISSITLYPSSGTFFDTVANFGAGPGANGGAYLWGGN